MNDADNGTTNPTEPTTGSPNHPRHGSFSWGTSTSALQNEGARSSRAEALWDHLADEGKTADGSDPSVASDHLARMHEDVDLIADLGVDAHRFSISWGRVMPDTRTVDEVGLDHYDRLVDQLLDRDIEPIAALHHLDLPLRHHEDGGWRNPATVDAFVDFAGAAAARLGDRVTLWSTMHDPCEMATTTHDPSQTQRTQAEVLEQLATAHRESRLVVRAHCPGGRVGIDVSDRDIAAIDRDHADLVFLVHDGSARVLRTALSALSHNHPDLPVIVMERGVPSHDAATRDGIYNDDDRIDELAAHLDALFATRRTGALVEGYLTPLLDGFEWADGLRRRTGLVRVDFESQERVPKESYRWYRSLTRGDDQPG